MLSTVVSLMIFSFPLGYYAELYFHCDPDFIYTISKFWKEQGTKPEYVLEKAIKHGKEVLLYATPDTYPNDTHCAYVNHYVSYHTATYVKLDGSSVTFQNHEHQFGGHILDPFTLTNRVIIAEKSGVMLLYICTGDPDAFGWDPQFVIMGVAANWTQEGVDYMQNLLKEKKSWNATELQKYPSQCTTKDEVLGVCLREFQ